MSTSVSSETKITEQNSSHAWAACRIMWVSGSSCEHCNAVMSVDELLVILKHLEPRDTNTVMIPNWSLRCCVQSCTMKVIICVLDSPQTRSQHHCFILCPGMMLAYQMQSCDPLGNLSIGLIDLSLQTSNTIATLILPWILSYCSSQYLVNVQAHPQRCTMHFLKYSHGIKNCSWWLLNSVHWGHPLLKLSSQSCLVGFLHCAIRFCHILR